MIFSFEEDVSSRDDGLGFFGGWVGGLVLGL